MALTVARTVAECRAAIHGKRVGLVPTMGAFHDGHVALMRRARAECDVVVVSLFVNPTQFSDPRDLASYPRDEARDTAIASNVGVDVLFVPSVKDMYPNGSATFVEVPGVSERLEGACRGAAHFRGVASAVTKLLNIVRPHAVYFGQKDAQQVGVVRRLVADLHLPVEIATVATVRESDGLAMSSRNVCLSPIERLRATSLYSALRAIESRATTGERSVPRLLEYGHAQLNVDRLDYLEIVEAETFAPLQTVGRSALVVVAAQVGDVRLIDNISLIASFLKIS